MGRILHITKVKKSHINFFRIYLKIWGLENLRDDMLKIRLRKTRLIIEINWPTKEKEMKTVGPFFQKIQKNAIQVSRKGIFIVITLGKEKRGKWGQLTVNGDEYPLGVDELEKAKIGRINCEEKTENCDFDDENGRNFVGKNEALKENMDKVARKFGHLPIFGKSANKSVKSGFSKKSKNMRISTPGIADCIKSVDMHQKDPIDLIEHNKKQVKRTKSVERVNSKFCGKNRKKKFSTKNHLISSENLISEIDQSTITLESVEGVNPFHASPTIRRGLMGTYVPRWSQNNSRKASFSKISSNCQNKVEKVGKFGVKKRSISRSKSPKNFGRSAKRRKEYEEVMFENSNPSRVKVGRSKKKIVKKKKKIEDMTKRVLRSLTPNQNRQNRQKSRNIQKSSKSKKSQKYSKSRSKSKSRRHQKTQLYNIKKFKKEAPALQNQLKAMLRRDRGESLDNLISKRSKRSKSKKRKKRRQRSWEKQRKRQKNNFGGIVKMVDNKEVLMQLEHYSMFNDEEKALILDNLITVLKDRLLKEQKMRMLRENELERIMALDNLKVEKLVS